MQRRTHGLSLAPVSFTTTGYGHIVIAADGVPIIAGTTVKVVELVVERMAYGWGPEELHFQHPGLSLGQIHAALAYYWDHAEALDQDVARRLEHAERLRREAGPSLLVARLKSKDLR